MRRIVVLACVAAMLWSPAAFAQAQASGQPGPSAAPPTAEGVTPEKEALVRRYFQAIHFDRSIDAMTAAMLPALLAQAARNDPGITEAQKAMVGDIVHQIMRDEFVPKLRERVVPIYAAAFTRAELEAIVAFYESPVGQAVTAKTPQLAPQVVAASQSLIPEFQAELLQKLCQRLGCDAVDKSAKS